MVFIRETKNTKPVGTHCQSRNRKLRVDGIRIQELREPVKVYNFEVEEYHTYYVGDAEIRVRNDNRGQNWSTTI